MVSIFTSPSRSVTAWAVACLCLGAAQPSMAAEHETSVAGATEAHHDIRPELVVETELPARPLTLDEALALSVKHNLGVEVARYEPQSAEQDIMGAWGAYDPTFAGNIGIQLVESPNTFQLNSTATNQQRILTGGTSLTGLLPYIGATVGIEMETARTRTNSTIESLTPRYDSSIFLVAKIPVLRGLIWNQPWTQVKVSKVAYGASVDGFEQAVMDISEETIKAYWLLVANREQYGVARKSLETALALLDQTETQYEVGVVSKVDVVEAEAGVAEREFTLIKARNDYENAEDVLVDAVLGRELKATMTFRIDPADDPEDYTEREVDVEDSVRTALERLPELSAADRAIERSEIELKFAKNSRLPQFDVEGRYGYANVSGEANVRQCASPFAPPSCATDLRNSGGFQSSFDNMYTEDGFENYSVAGIFSIPLPNRTARANVTKGEIDLRRAKSRKVRTKQEVIVKVRAAARGILASARGIEAAERRRLAAEEQLRAERIRLEHGESTPFEVLQRESDLVEAQSAKIGALRSYREAEARLERAQGTILDTYRIAVEDVREPRY